MAAETPAKCTICGGHEWKHVLSVADDRYAPDHTFDVRRCVGCRVDATFDGEQHVDPGPHYPDAYGAFVASPGDPRAHRSIGHVALGRMAWARELRGSGLRVLDVGCGSGRLLSVLDRWGLEVQGIEPSAVAVEEAVRRGLDVRVGTIDCFADSGVIDVLVLSHVLEHATDPVDVLAHARRILRPGGLLVIGIPNRASPERRIFGAHWDGWDIPRHVHHFDPPALTRLLTEAGFRVEHLRFEAYAIFARSARNAGAGPRMRRVLAVVDRIAGLFFAVVRRSGAMQVVARNGGSGGPSEQSLR